ncbi:MAG: hypothetical protein ACK55W_06405, partial [Pseudomonadota bacterium]
MKRFLSTALVLAAFAAQPALAQPPAAAQQATAPAAAAAPPAPRVDLADAYRREFAFLEAQKRELTARLAQTRQSFDSERARLAREVDALENRVLAARSDTESMNEQLAAAERQQEAVTEGSELLAGTLAQAQASLGLLGRDLGAEEAFKAASVPEQ